MTTESKNKPAHKVPFGNIEVTIWENTNKDGEIFHSFNLRRSYKDKEDNWQEQNVSLGRNDVMKAAAALTKAQMDFYSLPQFSKPADSSESPSETAA
jgi:hypothetical protein